MAPRHRRLWVCLLLLVGLACVAEAVRPPKGADCDYDYPERCVHGGGRIAASVSAATADETPPPPPPPPPGSDPSRRSWPELVGQPAKSARVAIEADNPDLTVVVVPPHALVTADYRPDRVRVYVTSAGLVRKTPVIG